MSEQRTPEWFAKRCGKFTGSRFAAVIARNKTTGKPLKSYSDLIWQLVVERLTGICEDGVDSYSMRWGREVEDSARQEYELLMGVDVDQVDFIDHPALPYVGCSPDGLVGASGGVEFKCPKDSAIHLARFIDGIGEEFIPQVQGCMWATGRAWWDWCSYDPRMPESLRLLRIRIERDQDYIDRLEAATIEAEVKVKELVEHLLHSGTANLGGRP